MQNVESVGVIVNCHELFHFSKKAIGGSVCYNTLMRNIVGKDRLVTGASCVIGQAANQQSFLPLLQSVGLTPILRANEMELADQFVKAIIDIGPTVSRLVLVTNSDNIDIVLEYLEMTHRLPKVELWFFPDAITETLREAVDTVRYIDTSFLYQKSRRQEV
jgi:hypothetical protein